VGGTGFNASNGENGEFSIFTNRNNTIEYAAMYGGGGTGSNYNSFGSGGANDSTYGTGGSVYEKYTNVQPESGTYVGDGQNGSLYTFQDGTNTQFYFAGGGGGGGSNWNNSTPYLYLGGGGFVGTKNAQSFTNSIGGCGGNGSVFNIGENGNNFVFNNSSFSCGSGGGAGGNNYISSTHVLTYNAGKGSAGSCILYFPN
jgi:hypothetical protein